ncbi:hypothetical protein SUGI_1225130 [Cryptomeria japonica]|uniref:Uncharacterized protein n=1 Tax=Cryptomeria japonica TaxID=3369 RepID=A0AAD3NPQ1_CRYJA|nr:hypothetical protein SUGI_1225130 [Cryptomeria japonica]
MLRIESITTIYSWGGWEALTNSRGSEVFISGPDRYIKVLLSGALLACWPLLRIQQRRDWFFGLVRGIRDRAVRKVFDLVILARATIIEVYRAVCRI